MTQRVVFFGTPEAAVPSLTLLHEADDVEVVAVVTNPDRPRGRHKTPVAPPVKTAAIDLGIDVWQPEDPVSIAADLAHQDIDLGVVVAYGKILAPSVLTATRLGFVNLHFSVLPRWRGAAPVQHALRAGDRTTGATTFVLDEGMDTGPVIATITTTITDEDDAGSLLERLGVLGAELLSTSVRRIARGEAPTPQSNDGVTYAPKIEPADLRIDWTRTASQIARLVRSASPRPGATAQLDHRPIKVLRARPVVPPEPGATDLGSVPVGTVLEIRDDEALVRTGDGLLAIGEVQPAGRRRMSIRDLANGMGGLVGRTFH